MRLCFEAVTSAPAALLGLPDYGIAPGRHADLVLLQAQDVIEALRLQATRLKVWRRGQLVVTAQPATSTLCIPGRPAEVDFLHKTNQGAKS
jgi:cytosine deaminase